MVEREDWCDWRLFDLRDRARDAKRECILSLSLSPPLLGLLRLGLQWLCCRQIRSYAHRVPGMIVPDALFHALNAFLYEGKFH